MKKFESATMQEFQEQFKNLFWFNDVNVLGPKCVVPSFIYIFEKYICSILVDGEEKKFLKEEDWAFAKTPKGFVFPHPILKDGQKLTYISKMNHSDVETTAIIAGYCSTLIWLSLVLGSVSDVLEDKTYNDISKVHEKGMSYYKLKEYFNEDDMSNMYSILD